MRRFLCFLFILFCIFALAFKNENDKDDDKAPLFEKPNGWEKPVYDFSQNPLHKDAVYLGRVLFYDPILSRDSTISCASCHSPYNAFTHVDHDLSHGIDGRIGTRNAPALMNLAWHKQFMWDGAIHHLDVQAMAPISHPDEMDENMAHLVEKLERSEPYRRLFYHAFADSTITGERLLKAMAQFLVTLVSADSKYDKVMRRETVFSAQEKKGYQLFKRHCATCHTEPLFTNLEFKNNGLAVDTFLWDKGRMTVTQRAADSLCFKVPTLRNIEFSYPYMHDGRFKKLSGVLQHYTTGIQQSSTLADELRRGIPLSANDKADLMSFLLTLSDTAFLFDARFSAPKIPITTVPKQAATENNLPASTTISRQKERKIPHWKVIQDSLNELLVVQMTNLTQVAFTVQLLHTKRQFIEQKMLYPGSTIVWFDTRTLYDGDYIVEINTGTALLRQEIVIKK